MCGSRPSKWTQLTIYFFLSYILYKCVVHYIIEMFESSCKYEFNLNCPRPDYFWNWFYIYFLVFVIILWNPFKTLENKSIAHMLWLLIITLITFYLLSPSCDLDKSIQGQFFWNIRRLKLMKNRQNIMFSSSNNCSRWCLCLRYM